MCVLINTTCLPVSRLSPSTSLPRCHVTGSALCSADVGEQLLSSVSTCNITCSSLLAADPGERLLSNVSTHHLFLSAFIWPRWTIAFQCFNTSPVPLSADAGEQLLSIVSTHYSSAFSWPRWTIVWLSTHRTSRSIHQAQRCCTRSSDTGTSCRTTRMSSRRRGPTSLHSENAKTCWVPCGEKSSRSPNSWVGVSASQELEQAADLVTCMIWVKFGRLTFNSIALRSELVRWPLKPHHFGAFWQKSQKITPNSTYFKHSFRKIEAWTFRTTS